MRRSSQLSHPMVHRAGGVAVVTYRCPNPLDSNISFLYVAGQSQDPHMWHFEVKAFQFMDLSTNKYLNEEIYFMCSTEVCMPSQTPCKETCFDGKVLPAVRIQLSLPLLVNQIIKSIFS
ncbi:hypothetical protein SRHO_G00014760 [Serrasalmus rhombeus]